MAKIRDYAVTTEAVATASMVMNMPVHETGDLLVAFVNKDTSSNFTTPANWTAVQTQVSAGAGGGVYTKRAASASETVTFAYTSETACGCIVAVQDCYGSTAADAVSASAKSAADDSTLPLSGMAITPAHADCLILTGLSTDSGIGPNALPPWVNLAAIDAGANSLGVAYTQQYGTAAAVAAASFWGGAADDSRAFSIAIRPATSGMTRDGYIPLSTTPARQISPMNGSTGVVDKGTWALAAANVITSVGGKTVVGIAIGTTADSGINPYRGSALCSGIIGKVNYSSVEINLTATDNLTNLNGLIFLTFRNLSPSDYKDCGTVAQGGKYIVFGSDSTNFRAWKIGGFGCKTEVADARNNTLIEFDTTDTNFATTGTPNWATLDLIQFGTMGYNAACALTVNEIYLINTVILAGGTVNNYLNTDDIVFVTNNGCGYIPLILRSGVQITCWAPMVFGGVDPFYFNDSQKVMAFPQKADGTKYMDCHVSANKLGITFDGQDRGSGNVDEIRMPGWLFTSPSSYHWQFAATHDAGAIIDFSGCTIINAAVTLRSTVALNNVSFSGCTSFTQNAAVISDSNFLDTKVTAAALADLEDITDCSFASSGTGYAVEVGGSASTITLTGCQFTGYASSNGSTGNEAIYVNIATGTVTINIAGGGSTPSVRTAGATVNVVSGATITFTGLPVGTDIVILTAGTSTILNQVDAHGATSYGWTYTGTPTVDVGFIKPGYIPFYIRGLSLTVVSSSIPISLAADRNYI